MDTELLRTFTVVVRTGSFTGAARELGYVQSTVTGHLQTLERRLATRLLDRLPTGSVPTDAGRRLLTYAEQILDLESRLADEVPQTTRPAGRVRLVGPESLCAHRLAGLLPRLRAVAPEVEVVLAPGGSEAALAAVRAGTAEAALLLESAFTAADLSVEALGVEELALVTAPVTTDDRAQTATWEQLAQVNALLLEEGCTYSDDVARRLLAAGQPDSRRIRFGSIEAIKHCVAAGLGWTVLPAVTVAAELRAGTLAARSGPLPPAPAVHLVTHRDRTASAATRLVLEHVRAVWQPVAS